jgi:DNA-binding MarR family transcriptional regulator
MIARLRDMGLVERLPDQEDSRAWNLKVSEDGRAALKRIEQPFRRINQKIEAALEATRSRGLPTMPAASAMRSKSVRR